MTVFEESHKQLYFSTLEAEQELGLLKIVQLSESYHSYVLTSVNFSCFTH